MQLETVVLLCFACGSLSEGNSRQFGAMPGVNSRTGNTRQAQPFHCTNGMKDSKSRYGTTEAIATKRSTGKLPTTSESTPNQPKIQSTRQQATDQSNHDNQSTSEPPSTVQQKGMLSKNQKTQSNSNRTATVQSTIKPTTDRLNHRQSTMEPSGKPATAELADRELTSDQQPTIQVTSTPPTERPTTNQLTSLTSTSPTSLTERQLTSDQHTPKQLIFTSPTLPRCAPNMELGSSCDCANTGGDSDSCNCTGHEICVCRNGFLMNNNECVHTLDCHDNKNGGTYVNYNCSEKCTCKNNQLSCNSTYKCSPNAACRMENGVRRCYCNAGYVGDGEICRKLYPHCHDAYQADHRQDGLYPILPYGWPGSPFLVWCDMTTSGGGWTILQRRLRGGGFGNKTWQDYKNGFDFGSFSDRLWLGNEKIFYLTNQQNNTLRFDLVSSNNSTTYQEYSLFKIANESDNYRLDELGNSTGTAGDGMNGTIGCQFSTRDRDNDKCDAIHCSEWHGHRGWWYSNKCCNKSCSRNESTCLHQPNTCKKRCTKANLNGWYGNKTSAKGFFWDGVDNIVSAEMKIRPVKETVQ